MLTLENISFGFSQTPLYEGVSFRVSKSQKVALTGPNGAGKSTLLKIILGAEAPSSGTVAKKGSVSYVPQEIKNDPVLEQAGWVRAYVDPHSVFADHEILKVFSGLELSADLKLSPKKLSGGQKTKLALARALLSRPDILLLDEPTNFMDSAGKKWVMNFLSDYKGSVIIISHDLALMDSAITKVLAINPSTQKIEEYSGNYTQYLKLKKEKEDLLKRQILVKQKHIKQMEEGLHNMVRFTSAKGVRRRVMQQRRIEKEKAALPAAPAELRKIKIKLPEPAKVGELPLRAVNISKSYEGNVVLRSVNFSLKRGERVALVGPNGTGKSTFIKILLGVVSPDSGEVFRSDALNVGYYSQEFESFSLEEKVIDAFMEKTHKDEHFARAFLGRFLLSENKVFQRIETLSGGEKTRLSIAILTANNHNVLVLDEPTTYLDVLSQRIILESLKEYEGAMLVVSHTPEFLIELAPSRAYLFPEEKEVFWDESLVAKVEEV